MSRKLVVFLSFVIMASMLLTACGGGSAPVTAPEPFSKLSADSKLDSILATMLEKEQAAMTGYKLDMKAYSTTASADEVAAYYKEYLKDWTSESAGDVPAGITFLKWSKSANNVFVLMVFPMPDGSEGQAVVTEFATK
jgi:hypothetical protein